MSRGRARALAALAGCALAAGASAQQDILDYGNYPDHVEEAPAWREQALTLPPYPQEDALQELPVAQAGPGHEYAIDLDALSVGEDGVVRYTVVIRSARGAENVLHEGLRCGERAYKTYAYGRADGTFREVKRPRWKPITTRGLMSYRSELAHGYFCTGFGPQSEAVIRDRLEHARLSDPVDGQTFTY